jgi:hypothetical protein
VEDKGRVADAAAAVARGGDRGAWAARKPPDRAVTVSARVAGTGCPIRSGNPVTTSSVPSVARP